MTGDVSLLGVELGLRIVCMCLSNLVKCHTLLLNRMSWVGYVGYAAGILFCWFWQVASQKI